VPSYVAKFVPINVTREAASVNVFDGVTLVTKLKSNENDAVNEAKRSCDASESIARVATTFNPYDAPVMISTLKLESDFHSVVSQADPPNRIVGEYPTRAKLNPNVVTENEPDG